MRQMILNGSPIRSSTHGESDSLLRSIEPGSIPGAGAMETVSINGQDWPIYYGICRCTAWPLFVGLDVGRCGRCGERPRRVEANSQEEANEILLAETSGQMPDHRH